MHYVMVLRCHFNVVQACNRRHVPERPIDRVSIGKESLSSVFKINVRTSITFLCPSAKVLSPCVSPRDSDGNFRPGFFSCLLDSETSIAIRTSTTKRQCHLRIHSIQSSQSPRKIDFKQDYVKKVRQNFVSYFP